MATEQMNILVTFKNAAKAGVKGLSRDLDKVGRSSQKAATGMKGMYAQLAGIGALLAGGALFGGAIKTFANFDDQMRAAGAVTGAMTAGVGELSDEMKAMTEVAKDMGRTTRYTASQAAEALRFLGMAGFTATQATKALPGTLQLAAAGALDLGTAADITTNVLTGFGIEVERLADVNDVLVKTFTSSNVNLIEIGEAFKFVGPIAKGVGADFEDLVGSIGALGNAGLKGTIAGTALKGAIAALMAPTAQEAALMNGLKERLGGVSLQVKDTAGDFIGFRKIIQQLETAGIDGSEALEMFGLRAGPGMAALINQGSDALVGLVDKLKNSGYTAEQIATIMEEGLGGELRRTISVFESFKIAIGEAFGPGTIKFLQAFQLQLMKLEVVIKEMQEAGDFAGWGDTVIKVMDGVIFVFQKSFKVLNAFSGLFNSVIALTAGNIKAAGEEFDKFLKNSAELFGGVKEDKNQVFTFEFVGKDGKPLDRVEKEARGAFEAIGKGAQKTGKKIGETLFPKPGEMTNLKETLIRVRAALATQAATLEKNYAEGAATLQQYYDTRLQILKDAQAAERAIIERKLYVESDVDKKVILNAQLYALDQALVADTIGLEQEKFKATEKLEKDRLKTADNINKLKLKADQAYKDQKARLEASEPGLANEFLKETSDMQERQNKELEATRAYHEAVLADLKMNKAAQVEVEQATADQIKAIKDQTALQAQEADALAQNQQLRLTEYRLDAAATMAKGTADIFQQLYEVTGKKNKELFYAAKAAAVAEATINIAQGVTKAIAQGGIYGIVTGAIVAAAGAVQIGTILSQGLAEGGEVLGSSPSATADNIPIRATAGEYMQPVSSVQHYGMGVMEGIRNKSIPKEALLGYKSQGIRYGNARFASGGAVSASSGDTGAATAKGGEQTNIVNVLDPAVFDQYTASQPGQRNILNVMSENIFEIRQMVTGQQ